MKQLLILFFLLQGTANAGFLLNCQKACTSCLENGGICQYCNEEEQKIICKKVSPRRNEQEEPDEKTGFCRSSENSACIGVGEGNPCNVPWITPMPGQCWQTDLETEYCECQPLSPY